MSKYCRSCGEPLTVAEAQLDDKLGPELSVCLPCLRAALKEIKKEKLVRYYYYKPDELIIITKETKRPYSKPGNESFR